MHPLQETMIKKYCTKCEQVTERSNDGDNRCLSCRRRVRREYRKKNPEQAKAADKRSYKRNASKIKARVARWRNKNPEVVKRYYDTASAKRLGMSNHTDDIRKRLMKEQRGECIGCGVAEADLSVRLSRDHDHRSGKIRMLLCSPCNTRFADIERALVAEREACRTSEALVHFERAERLISTLPIKGLLFWSNPELVAWYLR